MGLLDAPAIPLVQKAAPNGVATLDGGSKIPSEQLPAVAISDFLGAVASEAAMLALVGQRGDWCVRSDFEPDQTWLLIGDDATQLANWHQASFGGVSTVAGRTGVVTLAPGDIAGFDTQVRTSRLDQMAAPTGDVQFGGHRAVLLADPVDATDAATKGWAVGAFAPDSLAARIPAYSVYVVDPVNGSDSNNGKSWGRALRTIAAAMTAIYADGALGRGYKATVFLGPSQHMIGTAGSAAVGLTVPQNVHIYGCGSQSGSGNQGGTELVYLGTGIAVETAFDAASGWSTGTLQDFGIINGGSGTIGLHVRNAQNQAEVNRVRVGSTSDATKNFSTNAVLIDATDGTQQYPGFVKFRECWFIGGTTIVKCAAGVTQGMFDTCGMDTDDTTIVGFNLVPGISGDSGFDPVLLSFKYEAHNGIGTPPTAALVADSTAGQVTAGTHVYAVSVVTAAGESPLSTSSAAVTADATHTKVTVTVPVEASGIGAGGKVLSRKLYRSATGTTTPLKLLATIGDNTTTTYTDTTPDAGLGASYTTPTAMDAVPYKFDASSNIALIGCSARQAVMGTKSAYLFTPSPVGPGFPRMTLLNCHALNTARWLETSGLSFSSSFVGPALVANTVYTDSYFGMGQGFFRRLSSGGSTLSTTNWAASAGWGSTASVAIGNRSSDMRGAVTVTSAGTGQAANPTLTLTFVGGSWSNAPFVIVTRNGGAQLTIAYDWTTSTTTLTITWRGTPVAGETYTFDYMVMG